MLFKSIFLLFNAYMIIISYINSKLNHNCLHKEFIIKNVNLKQIAKKLYLNIKKKDITCLKNAFV